MTFGYVHVGAPTHGVSRYGRILAAAVRQRGDVRVVECELSLDGTGSVQDRQIVASAERLAGCDLIHLQYNNLSAGSIWGAGWQQLAHLKSFVGACRVPFVVTVHDVYHSNSSIVSASRNPFREVRRRWRARPRTATLRWLRRHASRVFVCSQEEQSRVSARDARVCAIPHFVEPRRLNGTSESAKAALALGGRKVVTLLGYIHERKGHALLIKALSQLPDDVVAVFAGDAPHADRSIVPELVSLARSRGVEERLRITGYLSEEQLELHMAATDVAACPFKRLSASGSLSSWISMARPIVATNLPQIAEYNTLVPDAIVTFDPYTETSLATAVRSTLQGDIAKQSERVARLRAKLALPLIVNRHLDAYRQALAARSAKR